MELYNAPTGEGEDPQKGDNAHHQAGDANIVRLVKPIAIIDDVARDIDPRVVSPKFFNSFNFSLLAKEKTGLGFTVGVTSARPGEGKTLVASNLAVSLATANHRDTVLVDLNVAAPRLHTVFGTKLGPGLVEALDERIIHVWQTKVKNLFVLSAGNVTGNPMVANRYASAEKQHAAGPSVTSLGLEQMGAFRDIVYSLKQEFEFIIIDMASVHEPSVPVLLSHQMDGLLVVIGLNSTKHEDIEKLLRRVHKNHILGFVLNRAGEGSDE